MYYYNARYYNPKLGRFISADAIVPSPGNPQAFNRYSYVLNNPLAYNDPSGHWRIGISFHAGIGFDLSYDFDKGHFHGGVGYGYGWGASVGDNNWDIGASNDAYVDYGYDNKSRSNYITGQYYSGITGPAGPLHGYGASATYDTRTGDYQVGGGVGYYGVGLNGGYSSAGNGSWNAGGTILQANATYDFGSKSWHYGYTIDVNELMDTYAQAKVERRYNGCGTDTLPDVIKTVIDILGTVPGGPGPCDCHDGGPKGKEGYMRPASNSLEAIIFKTYADIKLGVDITTASMSNVFKTNGLFKAGLGLFVGPAYTAGLTVVGWPAFNDAQLLSR